MSFQNFKSNSFCVGQKHYSDAKNIVGEIAFIKKTGKQIIFFLVGKSVICNRKISMIVSDNATEADRLGSFFKSLGRIAAKTGKKLATNVLENPGRALQITSNIATAAANESPKNVKSALHELINFYHTRKGVYSGKFV